MSTKTPEERSWGIALKPPTPILRIQPRKFPDCFTSLNSQVGKWKGCYKRQPTITCKNYQKTYNYTCIYAYECTHTHNTHVSMYTHTFSLSASPTHSCGKRSSWKLLGIPPKYMDWPSTLRPVFVPGALKETDSVGCSSTSVFNRAAHDANDHIQAMSWQVTMYLMHK